MPKPRATALAPGAILPTIVKWEKFFDGSLQQRFSWEMPVAGSYVLERSTDLVAWDNEGSFHPTSPSGGAYSMTVDPAAEFTAYQMKVVSIDPVTATT